MSGLLHTSGPTTSSTSSFGGRTYDYTRIYSPDKRGEEAKENARVWNVYLDEAENYDADMIQGFRNIIDSLLVFAALFSAVVTTFVAQSSQSLQPDNTQIMVALLIETNQLLRAAGNGTSISTVPTATLGPESRTYTSIDIWVNGLFCTSLALSLSTALLTVLAKQWIQAYTAIVPGGAKTRALIRHFRFQGLVKWKLGDIIEGLPLILHGSVAIFLVGFALYASQLSSPICGVVSCITVLTFLFYLGTSMLPAFDIACPYRIPFMFSLARPLVFAFRATRSAARPWQILKESLKTAEHNEVFLESESLLGVTNRFTYDSLGWLFNHSSNHSVKEVVVEGACGLLNGWSSSTDNVYRSLCGHLISSSKQNNLFLSTITYLLSQLLDMSSTSTTEDEIEDSTCAKVIGDLMEISSSSSLLDGRITDSKDWKKQIEDALINAYLVAVSKRYHALCRRLLDWGPPSVIQPEHRRELLFRCAESGDAEDIRDLANRGINLNHRSTHGWSALHCAAAKGNLDGVIALVEREPALMSGSVTALTLAIEFGNSHVVAYLLDRGVNPPSNAAQFVSRSYGVHPDRRLVMKYDPSCDFKLIPEDHCPAYQAVVVVTFLDSAFPFDRGIITQKFLPFGYDRQNFNHRF